MPLPTPQENEDREAFLERCLSDDKVTEEFPDNDQRFAVCQQQWEENKEAKNMTDRTIDIKKTDSYNNIVMGEVYIPNVVDTDGETITAEDVEKMAHDFMKKGNISKIDINHDFNESGCVVVESFVARKGDPDFEEGAWVMAVQCPDDVFQKVLNGELNGFSFAGTSEEKKRARVLMEVSKTIVNTTMKNNDGVIPEHEHTFIAYFDREGQLIQGQTDELMDHYHEIKSGTTTEVSLGHSHRIHFSTEE